MVKQHELHFIVDQSTTLTLFVVVYPRKAVFIMTQLHVCIYIYTRVHIHIQQTPTEPFGLVFTPAIMIPLLVVVVAMDLGKLTRPDLM